MVTSTTAATPPAGRDRPMACGYCGFPISREPVHRDAAGSVAFCSETCADAYDDGDDVLADSGEFRPFRPGVPVLDTLLPWGMPRNSSVLLSGEEGVRHRGLQTELVWRALQRDESAIMVSFLDSPVAIVAEFLSFGWNVLPYLEAGDLHIVDCLTNLLREQHQTPDRRTALNAHFEQFLGETVSVVRDPSDLKEVETRLHDAVDRYGMDNSGIVAIDSINEASAQGQEFRTEQFFEEIRTDVCKRFFVPIFTSTTITQDDQFSKQHAYIFDGIVDMRHDERVVPNVRLKQISIRKMDGVRYRPDWVAYENAGPRGFVPFDPQTEFSRIYPRSGTVGGNATGPGGGPGQPPNAPGSPSGPP